VTDTIIDYAYRDGIGGTPSVDSISCNDRKTEFLPFARFKKVKRFGSLDGWRAFAILAVIWHHTLAGSFASPIAQEGRHGVTLFFVISGFLIITLLLRSNEGPGGFTLWKFWGRRALRIFPIYYTVLLAYAIIVGAADHSQGGADFFRNLPFFATFTTNWFVHGSDHTIFFFSWSLAAEEQFYLIWPLIEVLISRLWLKFILLGIVAVTSRIVLPYADAGDVDSLPLRILADVPLGITLGTGLAHLLNNATSFRIAYKILGQRGSAFGCLAFAVVVAIVSPEIGFAGEIAVPVVFLLLIASTVVREDHDLAAMLRWQPMAWIGTVSYGMYMMHMLAVNAVRTAEPVFHIGSPVALFVGSVAAAMAMASLSFVFFERPFLVLKDRFFLD